MAARRRRCTTSSPACLTSFRPVVGALRELVMLFATAALWITLAALTGWTQTCSTLVQPEHMDRLTVDTTMAERASRGVRVPGLVMILKGLLGKANVRFCSTAAVLLEQRSFLPAAQGAERPHTPRSREGAAGRVHVQVHARPPNEVHLGWQGVADARGEVRFLRAPLACLPTGPPDIQLVASRPKQRLKEGVRNWAQPMAPSMGIRWFIWIR